MDNTIRQPEVKTSHNGFVKTLLKNWYCCGMIDGRVLINALKYDSVLRSCYEQPIQDLENQTLEIHTIKVIDNFLVRFKGRQSLFTNTKDFILFLALHDIGKPDAFAAGDRNLQGHKSLKIIDRASEIFPVSAEVLDRIKIMINEDIIGCYLNPFYAETLEKTVAMFKKTCNLLGMKQIDFWQTLVTYYQCDASSYQNLRERLFIIDECGRLLWNDDRSRLLFKAEQENMFLNLEVNCIGNFKDHG